LRLLPRLLWVSSWLELRRERALRCPRCSCSALPAHRRPPASRPAPPRPAPPAAPQAPTSWATSTWSTSCWTSSSPRRPPAPCSSPRPRRPAGADAALQPCSHPCLCTREPALVRSCSHSAAT
jgi:hypothetical protein